MNRLRTRKKSHEDGGDKSQHPSLASDVPAIPSLSSRTLRRKKKVEPAPKPELNLAEALPPTDDFRTSLLLPNLSARFSMLREQDDPNSKLGKANDDSVLFPKRASRLDLFGVPRPGLSDIAEVDSLHRTSAPRPPFASTRTESYGSDAYGTDDGSVMNRARPGEGNTMFGGRQKVYKIPVGQAGSIKSFGKGEEGEGSSRRNMGGKAIYESDTFPSAFQLARERERQENQEQDAATDDQTITRSSKEQDRSGSPPYARYNKNRETTSSTNSGPSQSRASTAATSIASHRSVYNAHETINGAAAALPDRPMQRGKKLYGQASEQHQLDQQSSLQRMNSADRSRGALRRNLTQSRSATNLNDRFQRTEPAYTSNGFRAASPSPSPTPRRVQDFDLGLNCDGASASNVDTPSAKSPATSPSMTPHLDPTVPDPTLVAALEPNDLGKATASGAFNKPQQQYNEHQYLQRQLQLQEGRNTPSPGPLRTFSPTSTINEQITSRSRNNSQGSGFSRTNSTRRVWEHHMEDRVLRSVPERSRNASVRSSLQMDSEGRNVNAGEQSFFGGISGGEIGSNPESETETDVDSPLAPSGNFQCFRQPPPPPTSQTKPKSVQSNTSFDFELNTGHVANSVNHVTSEDQQRRNGATLSQPPSSRVGLPKGQDDHVSMQEAESRTARREGSHHDLSGIVKQHLRNVSSTSSVYPEDSPRRSRPEIRESIFGHESALNQQASSRNDHAQGGDWKRANAQSDETVPPMPPPLSFAAKQILEQATALKNQGSNKAKQFLGNDNKAHRVLGDEVPRTSHESSTTWQNQLRSHHSRVGSTETERERESLANEMEARRRMVMNNLQTFVEGESRDASPAHGTKGREGSPARFTNGFSILKKNTGGQAPGGSEKPSKALKMLGIDSNGTVDPAPEALMGRAQYSDRAMPPAQNRSKSRQRSDSSPSKAKRAFFGSRSNQNSRKPSPQSSGSDGSDMRPDSRKRSAGKSMTSSGPFTSNGAFAGSETIDRGEPPISRDGYRVDGSETLPLPIPASAFGSRSRSNSKTQPAPCEQTMPPGEAPNMINPSAHVTENSWKTPLPPPIHRTHPQYSATHPTMVNPQQKRQPHSAQTSPRHATRHRSGSINKQDISEPTFISCTSTVDTVELPPGASLRNGMDEVDMSSSAPPIPTRDSRRKRAPNFFHAFSNRKPEFPTASSPTFARAAMNEESPFEGRSSLPDGFDSQSGRAKNTAGHRTKRSISDGARFDHQETQFFKSSPRTDLINGSHQHLEVDSINSPALPTDQHVPYQAMQDVPASAVMF